MAFPSFHQHRSLYQSSPLFCNGSDNIGHIPPVSNKESSLHGPEPSTAEAQASPDIPISHHSGQGREST